MSSNIVLVLGAGPRVGLSIIKKFAQNGYKTIGVSRSPSAELQKTADLAIGADLTKHENIKNIFAEAKTKVGTPNVVVFNTGSAKGAKDPFTVSMEDFISDVDLNVIGAYAALKYALTGFAELPLEQKKTFIYTGNVLTNMIIPGIMNNGIGKRSSFFMVENAIATHKEENARFYFADERFENGAPVYGKLDGEAHGKFYFELADSDKQEPFQATFVKGKGYVDFKGKTGSD